jgi:hypothetical protein
MSRADTGGASSRRGKTPPRRRVVIHGDAVDALPACERPNAIVTSLPDADDLQWTVARYERWFRQMALLCLSHVADAGICIFYQTDRRQGGRVFSKAAILIDLSREAGHRLLWHKIVLRRRPGVVDLYRPAYSHLLGFSRRLKPGRATPDVFEPDRALHANGMHLEATRWAVRYAARQAGGRLLIDPFCGAGTVLAMAEHSFERVIGIDTDTRCVASARRLRLA